MITNTLFSFGRLRAASSQLLFGAAREQTPLGVMATLFLSLWVCLFTAPDSFGQAPISTTFIYNGTNGVDGSQQTFTVPTGVNQLTVVAWGAQGYGGSGAGGRVDAVMSVTAGQVLNINVGGQPSIAPNGGFNWGGVGGHSSTGGGGGATDILIGGTSLSNRVLVAGGGGGNGNGPGANSGIQGGGGDLTGGTGAGSSGSGGGGGTQSAGGAAGTGNAGAGFGGATGGAGSLGVGGNGAAGILGAAITNGGGGGGGYYGGGGGSVMAFSGGVYAGGSGGGGSSFPATTNSTVTSVSHTQGVRAGHGLIMLSYQTGPSLSIQVLPNPVTSGTATVSVTATNGTGPYSYTWVAPTGLVLTPGTNSSSVQVSTTACVTGQQTLTVLATDNGASPPVTTSATVSLTFVGVSVSITAAPSLAVASGSSVTLTASGATSYIWSNNSTANPLILPSVTSSTTLSVTGTTGFCSNTASVAVSLFSLSFVASPNPTSSTATVSVTATNRTGPFSYTWIAPADITLTGGSTSAVQAAANACISGVRTLTITVEDAGVVPSVRTTSTVNLTFAGVSVSITATPSLTIAPGGSVTLTASGGTSYTWSDNSTANPLVLTNVTSATTLSVTGLSGLCSNTASAAVSVVVPVAVPTLSASSSLVCEGSTVSVVGSTTSTVTSYQWFKDGVSLGAAQRTATLTLSGVLTTQAGNYSLVVSDGITSATSGAFSLSVRPLPTVTLVFGGATYGSLGPGMPVITLTRPIDPNNLPFFQVFGGVQFERKTIIDQISGYEIRQVQTNTTGVFNIERLGAYTITVTGDNGCQRTVQGVIRN